MTPNDKWLAGRNVLGFPYFRIAQVSEMDSLTTLELWGDTLAISDAGLAHLTCMTTLRELRLTNCKSITDAGTRASEHRLATVKTLDATRDCLGSQTANILQYKRGWSFR